MKQNTQPIKNQWERGKRAGEDSPFSFSPVSLEPLEDAFPHPFSQREFVLEALTSHLRTGERGRIVPLPRWVQ